MRSEGIASFQLSAMQRLPRELLKLRRFLGLLTLLFSLGDSAELFCYTPNIPRNGFVDLHGYEYRLDVILKYYCNSGFKLIGTHIIRCVRAGSSARWNGSAPLCKRFFCEEPPSISNGFFTGSRNNFTYGSVVTYHCNNGFSLIGTPTVTCDHDDRIGDFWNGNLPSCKVGHCENPVVEHGVRLSEFKHTYSTGNTVTFECVIGYFMVGSYLIRCNEDNVWNPEVPSCRKIAPDLCGPPLIPSGSVHPLLHQYKAGTEVVVLCNPQQCFPDETTEMSTVCQGYNFWEPPVQPCFLRTSPDTFKLRILNGRIIGKKKHYIPGDNVTIQCYAGYSLRGPSTIRYIGGKKWLPEIPSCILSFFFILLILAIIFILLLLPVKRLYKYISEEGNTLQALKCFSQLVDIPFTNQNAIWTAGVKTPHLKFMLSSFMDSFMDSTMKDASNTSEPSASLEEDTLFYKCVADVVSIFQILQ